MFSPTRQGVIFFQFPSLFLVSCFLCWSVQTLKIIGLLGEFDLSFESIQGSLLSEFCFLGGVFAFWVLRSGIWWEISELSFGIIQESELGIEGIFGFL